MSLQPPEQKQIAEYTKQLLLEKGIQPSYAFRELPSWNRYLISHVQLWRRIYTEPTATIMTEEKKQALESVLEFMYRRSKP